MNSYTTLTVDYTSSWTATLNIYKIDTTQTDFYIDDVLQTSSITSGSQDISLSIASGNHIIKIDGGTFYFDARCLGSNGTNLHLYDIDFGTNYGTAIGGYAFFGCSNLTSITIPSGVTSIGERAFFGCTSLTLITIPNSVTSIGNSAFSGCSGITSITIGANSQLTSIGTNAFQNCSGLTSITIPSGVTSIGEYAFYGCSALTSITIPNGITSISNNTFYNCSSLTSLTIPSSVTSIDNYAFYQCSNLTSLTIPNSVASVGEYAFYWCSSLNSITIGANSQLTSIGQYAFYRCTSLTALTIPKSVTSIGNAAFSDCVGLTSITVDSENTTYDSRNNCNAIIETSTNTLVVGCKNTIIPNTVTSIGDYAFCGCTLLTSITIPNGVTSVGQYAFSNCNSLTSITIPNSVTSIGIQAFYNCRVLTSITIPSGVTNIGDGVFYYCDSLTSITIPSDVTSIGDFAFYYCSRLTSITIPRGVTSIGQYAFSGCSGLTSITCLAVQPPSLGQRGFDSTNNCPIYVPSVSVNTYKTATNWSSYAARIFVKSDYEQDGIQYVIDTNYAIVVGYTSAILPQSTILSSITVSGVSYNVTQIANNAFSGCTALTSIVIPDSITTINTYAFYNCTNLESVTMGAGVTNIGQWAFTLCESLYSLHVSNIENWCNVILSDLTGHPFYTSETYPHNLYINNTLVTALVIPNTVSSINDMVFYKCDSITSVVIPNSVSYVGIDTFSKCNNIVSLTIGNGVTNIGQRAFGGCGSLETVTFESNSQLTTIGNQAFQYCRSLTSIIIPDGVTSMGSAAFTDCSSITSIIIPDGLTSISNYVFRNCTSLTSITIPSSVTSIGTDALSNCTQLENLYISSIESWYNVSFANKNSHPFGSRDSQSNHLYINNSELFNLNVNQNIGNYTFYNCSCIENIILGNNVVSIGKYAFSGCSDVQTLEIPKNINTIGNSAFRNCSSLASITFKNITPPTVESDALTNTNDCPIYIPYSGASAYRRALAAYSSRLVIIPSQTIGNIAIKSITFGNTDVDVYFGNQILYKGIIPPAPAEGNFIKFVSDESFTLNVVDYTKYWDGTIEYSTNGSTWSEWNGTTTLSSSGDGKLYLRGTGNTKITGVPYSTTSATLSTHRWVFTGNADIAGSGNIENLLDYATVEAGNHPAMASGCFAYLFNNANIVSSPDLMATTLSQACYQCMYRGSSIVTAPVFAGRNEQSGVQNSITISQYCFRYMFQDCSSLKYLQSAFNLQAGSTATSAFNSIFRNCTSLEEMAEIMGRSSTIPSTAFQYLYYGCSNIKVSSTQTGEYVNAYNVQLTGTTTIKNALTNTGGTYMSTITPNRNYYTSNKVIRVYPQ